MHPLSFLGLFTASLGQCVLHCPYLAFFLSPTLLGQCALHCPSRAVFCPALLGTVLCTAPLGHYVLHCSSWVLVPCPSGALCSALPFLGHCSSGALCSALFFLGYDLHCPFLGTVFCTTPLGHCTLHCLSVAPLPLWDSVPCTVHYGQCFCTALSWHHAMYCPSGLCSACLSWSVCSALTIMGIVLMHCPSGALCSALPFWGTVLCTAPFGLCSALPLCALCSALLLFLGCIFTVLLGALCSVHCPSGSVCSVVPIMHSLSGLFCTTPLGTVLCTTPMFGLCSHCPSRSTLLCALPFWGTLLFTTLWCTVLCTGSDSGLPFWSSVLCPTHNVHYASVQPFLGHCALQCPFSALCSAQPFLGFALYCPCGAPCSALLFLGVVFLHCPSWALCPPLTSGVLCFSLPL